MSNLKCIFSLAADELKIECEVEAIVVSNGSSLCMNCYFRLQKLNFDNYQRSLKK